jgi:ABC-2 type transport system permease protein
LKIIKNILDIFRYKELIKALVERDLKARYKKSVLGYTWTWLDPLLTMFIFILIFDIILSLKVENFPIYLLSGLLPWIFFSTSVNASINTISGNEGLIKRIYFPREIFPLTITLSNTINMLLGILVLIPVILFFGIKITPKILLLPLPVFFLFIFTFGVCLLSSCINVFFRDMSYIVPFIINLGFYLTPIFYVIEGKIPANQFDIYMMINPLAVVLSLFRTSLMGYDVPAMKHIITAFAGCVLVFLAGYTFFKATENIMVKRI